MSAETLNDLNVLDTLSDAQRGLLQAYSVWVVEDLAGLLQADPTAVRELLAMDASAWADLLTEVGAVLDRNPELREEFGRPQRAYPLGAHRPD